MKKYLSLCLAIGLGMALISWGKTGHRTIGRIAENHLTDKAKQAIHDLIGDTSLADISTYADEIRSHEEYKYTSSWHYINLPTGLNHDAFVKAVQEQNQMNVYKALQNLELQLIDPASTRAQKVFALKLIVHFVGDLHQPMHVSRAEDQGGNKIMVTFNGKQGNLHGLWDSGLIEHQGLSYEQLAVKYDHPTDVQVHQWQHDDMLIWLYESYQVSNQLYKDAEANPNFDEDYYQARLPIIAERIEKAGIRLAGVLNDAFNGGSYSIIAPPPVGRVIKPDTIPSKDVARYIHKMVVVTGQIASTRLVESNNMTLLNVGADNPNQDFTIIIRSENRSKFGQPEIDLKGKTVTVLGMVTDYKGKPEIEILNPSQLSVVAQ